MDRREEPAHVLKLDMLLFVLQSHQQTCRLWAHIPARIMATATSRLGKGKIQTLCLAELVVREGQIQSCLVRDQSNKQNLLAGQIAFDLLQLCGILSWHVRPESEASSLHFLALTVENKPNEGPAEEVIEPPRQTIHLEQQQMALLPRKYRQVLNLVNGQRGIDELCSLLHCTREQLLGILTDLAAKQLIIWSDPKETRRK